MQHKVNTPFTVLYDTPHQKTGKRDYLGKCLEAGLQHRWQKNFTLEIENQFLVCIIIV